MGKFTYLLGAGASYNAFPLVVDFEKTVLSFLTLFEEETQKVFRAHELKDLQQEWIYVTSAIRELKNKTSTIFEKHSNLSSIDKKAKKFYLDRRNDDLLEIKAIIDFYFQAAQFIGHSKINIDNRYTVFFNDILKLGENDRPFLPPTFSILSWNYDIQLELTAAQIFKEEFLGRIHTQLNISPQVINHPQQQSQFSVVKLNGMSAMLVEKDKFYRYTVQNLRNNYNELHPVDKFNLIYTLSDNYLKLTGNYLNNKIFTGINYGWEANSLATLTRQRAKEIAKETEYLVIIGYSFPLFNREVDGPILNTMKKLKKVYIQIPEVDIETVYDRFIALANELKLDKIKIKKETKLNEFIIPDEYVI